jgi:hypothetical protein
MHNSLCIHTYIHCIPLTQEVDRITAGCRISHKNYKTVIQAQFQLSVGKEQSGYHMHSDTLPYFPAYKTHFFPRKM